MWEVHHSLPDYGYLQDLLVGFLLSLLDDSDAEEMRRSESCAYDSRRCRGVETLNQLQTYDMM